MRNSYRLLLVALLLLTLGIAGFAATEVAADTPAVYVVSWGDTLFSIATRYGTSVNALMRANNLTNPDFIYVGQRLLIPTGITPSPSGTYVVQAGDTLFSIAMRHGTTVSALMQTNRLYNYWIYVGQTLRIPGYGAPPAQPIPAPLPTSSQSAYYIVQPGDYLAMIANRYRSSPYAIQIANKLPNPALIWNGQRLYIPNGQEPTQPLSANPPPAYNPLSVSPPLAYNLQSPVPPVTCASPSGAQSAYPICPPMPTPYIPPVPVPAPPPSPTGLWEAVLITNTTGTGPCSLAAIVVGKTDWPVVVATTDGSWISDPKYTGTKPERGPYVVEFAHACTGVWRVIPLGLNIYADVRLNGGHAEVEFHPRS